MARAFNLTAQLNIVGPGNLKPIVAKIKRELGTVSANVKVNIDSKSAKSVDIVRARIDALNKSLITANSNTQNLNASLSSLASSLGKVQSIGAKTGTSINKTSAGMATTAKNIKVATTQIEEFGKQSALAVKRFAAFSIVTTGVVSLIGAISSGFKAFVNFDKEMIKLQQVTGKGAIGLKSLEDQITRLAVSMGVSSESLVDVATTLAQAGLSADETRIALTALAKTELAPSFDNLKDTTEGAIAAFRQFGLQAQDLEAVLGSINAVAAAFAVESSDIIAAIQRTGGVFAASSKGVSEGKDALNEFIAVFTSVRATTRESAETIATGLRTIFTRIQRSRTISLLREFGVELTDLEGKFVGPYEAIKRLSQVLNQLDPRDIRFSGIVEELGGFRQIGKVIPLIQQFATAQQALSVAQKGQNSLSDAQAIAQKSLAVQITKVREQFLALIRDVGKSTSFQALTKIVLGLTSGLISLVGAFKPVLPILGLIGAIKGASAIGQFATGFFGTLKKGGGAKGFGKNIGAKATGAKDREKNETVAAAATATRENTVAVVALTTALNAVGSKLDASATTTGSVTVDTSTLSTALDSVNSGLVLTVGSLNNLINSINDIGTNISNTSASSMTSMSDLTKSQADLSVSLQSVGGIMKTVGDTFRSSTDNLYLSMIDLIVVMRDLSNDIKDNKGGSSGMSGGGKVLGFNKGGIVPGNGGGDRIPALLEGGEVVMNRKAVQRYGANNLLKMNKQGSKNKKFASGGAVSIDKIIGIDKVKDGDSFVTDAIPKPVPFKAEFRIGEWDAYETPATSERSTKTGYSTISKDKYNKIKNWKRNQALQDKIVPRGTGYSIPPETTVTSPSGLTAVAAAEKATKIMDQKLKSGDPNKLTDLVYQGKKDRYDRLLIKGTSFLNIPEELKTGRTFKVRDGGKIQKFMSGGKAKETRPFGSGEFPFPKRISNAYFKEIDAILQKEQVEKAFSGGLGYLEYPSEKRIRVESSRATETFDSTSLDRTKFAESFKRRVSALSVYQDMSNFAKFIGLPREDLSLVLPENIDFSHMGGLGPGGQFDRTAMGHRGFEGYDLSSSGYGPAQEQDLYGYEKLVAEKQKEIKKILKTPVRTFEDGTFRYDEDAARKTWDEINDLQIRIMKIKKIKLDAQSKVGDQIRDTAAKTGRGAVSINTGNLGFIRNSTLYHELTHQLFQGLRTRSSETFDKYKARVVSLFEGDNNDLADAFDALENSYNSADVVYGRSYKIGLLNQVVQNNRTTSGKMALTPTAAKEANEMWATSLGIKKARDFKPVNPKVNQALLDNSIKQNVIDRVEDSGKEEFLTTLIQNAPKLDANLQGVLDSTLNELFGSAGITRQQYADGGIVSKFMAGGVAKPKKNIVTTSPTPPLQAILERIAQKPEEKRKGAQDYAFQAYREELTEILNNAYKGVLFGGTAPTKDPITPDSVVSFYDQHSDNSSGYIDATIKALEEDLKYVSGGDTTKGALKPRKGVAVGDMLDTIRAYQSLGLDYVLNTALATGRTNETLKDFMGEDLSDSYAAAGVDKVKISEFVKHMDAAAQYKFPKKLYSGLGDSKLDLILKNTGITEKNNAEDLIGKTFTMPSFLSASDAEALAVSFARTGMLTITPNPKKKGIIPEKSKKTSINRESLSERSKKARLLQTVTGKKGFAGIPIDESYADAYDSEGEYIFPSNSKFKITNIEKSTARLFDKSGRHINMDIQQLAKGGVVERKIGIIDTDVLRDPANAGIVGPAMEKLGITDTSQYSIELGKLAAKARKEKSLSRLTAIAGAAGSGKSSLATGMGANDDATLRKTTRSHILTPEDISKVNEVIALTSTVAENKLDAYLRDVDRAYVLSSTTPEEIEQIGSNRTQRDLTGQRLYGRRPGTTVGANRDFALEETTLRDELGKKTMVLGRKKGSFGLRRKRENELPEIVQAEGFYTGGFSPPTRGHRGAFEALLANVIARNPNATAADILVSVAPNLAMSGGEGKTEQERTLHAARYGILPADIRLLMAGINFPGAMITGQEGGPAGSLPKFMEVQGETGRRKFARLKGALAITSGKDEQTLGKYGRAGVDVTDIPRIEDISATKVRDALFNGDDNTLVNYLDPQIASVLMGNRAQLRNRTVMVPMLIEEIKKYAEAEKARIKEQELALLATVPGGPYKVISKKVRETAPDVVAQIEEMRDQRDRTIKGLLGYRAHNIISLLSSKYPEAYALDASRRAQVSASPADLAKETIAAHIAEGMGGEFGGAPTILPTSIQQAILEKVTKETAGPKGSGELPTKASEILKTLGDRVIPTDPKFGEFSGKKIRDTAKGAKLGYWMSKFPATLATKPEKLAAYEATRDYVKDLYSGTATETTAQALATRTADVSKSTLLGLVGLYGKNAINGPLTWDLGKNAQGEDVSMSATIMERVLPEQYKSVADYISSQTDITVAKAAEMLGKKDPKKLTEKQKGILNQGNIEGGILEQLLAVLGGDILDDAVRTRAIDFPAGIGDFAAGIFGIPSNIPTEAKRTINSDSRSDAIEEFQRHFRGLYGIPDQKELQKFADGGLALDDQKTSKSRNYGKIGLRRDGSTITATYFKNNDREGFVSAKKTGGNLYTIGLSKASKGYGPRLYDIVMEAATNNGGMLTSDRNQVSDSARSVWSYYFNNRNDVEKTPLDPSQWTKNSNYVDPKLYGKKETWPPPTDPAWILQTGYSKKPNLINSPDIIDMNDPKYAKFIQMQQTSFMTSAVLAGDMRRDGGKISKFANGGVLAKVSNGEAFVPPKAAKKIGYAKLDQMNKADRNGMQGFAGGGISVFKGPGSGTSDSIGPVSLPVGSYVIREKATKALGLSKGGSVGGIRRFADGGQSKIAGVSVGYLEAVIKEVANLGDSVSASTSSKAMGRLEDLLANAYIEGRVTAESTKKMVNILSALINVTSQSNKESSDKLTKLFDAIDRAQQKRGGTALKRPEEALAEARSKSLERVQKTLEAIGGGPELVTDPVSIDTGESKVKTDADTERRSLLKEQAAMSAFTSGNSLADVLSAMKDLVTEQETNRPSSIEKFKEQFKAAKTPEEKKSVIEAVKTDKAMAEAASKQNRELINDLNQLIEAEKKAGIAAKIAAEETELFAAQAKSAGLSQKAYGTKLGQDVLAKAKEKENIEPKRSAFRIAAIEARNKLKTASTDEDKSRIIDSLGSSLQSVLPDATGDQLSVIKEEVGQRLAQGESITDIINSIDLLKKSFTEAVDPLKAFQESVQEVAEATGLSADKIKAEAEQQQKVEKGTEILGKFGGMFPDFAEKFAKNKIGGSLVKYGKAANNSEGLGKFVGSKLSGVLGKDLATSVGTKFGSLVKGIGGPIAAAGVAAKTLGDNLPELYKQFDMAFGTDLRKSNVGAGVAGALSGAGTGAASGALLLSWLGPPGILIGGITGALVGGLQGFFKGFAQKELQNNLEALNKSAVDLDKAFKELEINDTNESLQKAQRAFGEVTMNSQKIYKTAATNNSYFNPFSYFGPGEEATQEAIRTGSQQASQNVETAKRLGARELKNKSTEDIGASLAGVRAAEKTGKGLNSAYAALAQGSTILQEYQKSQLQANGINVKAGDSLDQYNSAQAQRIKAEAAEQIYLEAYRKKQIQSGRSEKDVQDDITANKAKAIRAGRIAIGEEEALIRKQEELTRASKQLQAASASLIDVFRRVSATLERVSAEREASTSEAETNLNRLSGNAQSGQYFDPNARVLGNISAYSTDEVRRAATEASGLLGGGVEGEKVTNAAVASKVIQDELPAILRNTKGLDAQGVMDKIEESVSMSLGGMDIQSEEASGVRQILAEMKKNIERQIQSRQAGSMQEIDVEESLSVVSDTAQKAADLLQKTAQEYEKTINDFARKQDQANQKYAEAANYARQASTIRLNAELELAKASGRTLTLQEANKPFETEIQSMTSGIFGGVGSTDPVAISQQIQQTAAETEALQQDINQRRANRQAITGGDPQKLKEFDAQLVEDTEKLRKNNQAINEATNGLKRLAEDSSAAANAMEIFQANQRAVGSGVDMLENLLTQNPEEMQNTNRQLEAFRMVQTGTATQGQLNNFQFRQDATAGQKMFTSLLPEDMQRKIRADSIRQMLTAGGTDLNQKIAVGAGGEAITIEDALKRYEKPELDPAAQAALDAANKQAAAADQLSDMATKAGNDFLKSSQIAYEASLNMMNASLARASAEANASLDRARADSTKPNTGTGKPGSKPGGGKPGTQDQGKDAEYNVSQDVATSRAVVAGSTVVGAAAAGTGLYAGAPAAQKKAADAIEAAKKSKVAQKTAEVVEAAKGTKAGKGIASAVEAVTESGTGKTTGKAIKTGWETLSAFLPKKYRRALAVGGTLVGGAVAYHTASEMTKNNNPIVDEYGNLPGERQAATPPTTPMPIVPEVVTQTPAPTTTMAPFGMGEPAVAQPSKVAATEQALKTSTTKKPTKKKKPKETRSQALDWLQTGLDIAGLAPVVGELADIANGAIYSVRAAASTDKSVAQDLAIDAGLSYASAIPIGGYAANAAKFGRKGLKMAAGATVNAGVNYSTNMAADRFRPQEAAAEAQSVPQPTTRAANARVTTPVTPVSTTPAPIPQISPLDSLGPIDLSEEASRIAVEQEINRLSSGSQTAAQNRLTADSFAQAAQMQIRPGMTRWESAQADAQQLASMVNKPQPVQTPTPTNRAYTAQVVSAEGAGQQGSMTGLGISDANMTKLGEFGSTFNTTISSFGTYVDKLSKITFPDKIEMVMVGPTKPIEVNITGAAAFEQLEKSTRDLVDTIVANGIGQEVQKMKTDLSKLTGGDYRSPAATGKNR